MNKPLLSNQAPRKRYLVFNLFNLVFGLFWLTQPVITFGQVYTDPCIELDVSFHGEPEATLCDQYGDLSHLAQWGEGTAVTHSAQLGASYSGNVHIVGDFIIDNTFSLTNCIVKIEPGVKILVTTPSRPNTSIIFVINNSKLFACEGLWKGIELSTNTSIATKNGTKIEDAEKAIKAVNIQYCGLFIEQTTFNRNDIGIYLSESTQLTNPATIYRFNRNKISCTAPLNGTLDQVSYAGLWISDKLSVSIYPNSIINGNIIENIQYGIYMGGPTSAFSGRYFHFNSLKRFGIFGSGILNLNYSFFYNCDQDCINFQNIHSLNLYECTFNYDENLIDYHVDGNYRNAIHLRAFPVGSTCKITNCTFNSELYTLTQLIHGIYINADNYFTGDPKIIIDYNHWNLIAPAAYGIWFNGTTTSRTDVEINYNTFSINCPEGGGSGAAMGIANGNKFGIHAYSNTIEINEEIYGDWSDGVDLIGSEGFNNVFTLTDFPASFGQYLIAYLDGFFISNFDNSTFCYNTFRGASRGFDIYGTNELTHIYTNQSWDGQIIGMLSNSFIDQQIQNGNTWNLVVPWSGPFHLIAQYQAQMDNANDAQYSNFIVHTDQSTAYTGTGAYPFHPKDILPDNNNEWWSKIDGTPYNCLGSGTPSKFSSKLKIDIADGTFATLFDSAYTWQAERGLYRTLKHNLDSISSNANFTTFLTSMENSAIAKLYTVEESIDTLLCSDSTLSNNIREQLFILDSLIVELNDVDSILETTTDSATISNKSSDKTSILYQISLLNSEINDYVQDSEEGIIAGVDEIKELNDDITPSNSWESTEKLVYHMILNSIENGELSEMELDTVKYLADSCPKDVGMAVYFARGLVPYCNQQSYSDNYEDCYLKHGPPELFDYNSRSLYSADETALINNTYRLQQNMIYPNPTSGEINFTMPVEEIKQIEIYDLTGRKILTEQHNFKTKTTLWSMKDGIYWLLITKLDGTAEYQKFVLLK